MAKKLTKGRRASLLEAGYFVTPRIWVIGKLPDKTSPVVVYIDTRGYQHRSKPVPKVWSSDAHLDADGNFKELKRGA